MNDVELAVRLTADASDAVAAMDDFGGAATRMASDADSAFAKTDAASSRLDSAAESADNMASSSSQAAGGLGDLGGALALMPGPLGALGSGMEAAAPAIMGVTGASDLLSLAMNSNVIQTTRARAAAVAHRTATIAQAAATKAAAVAQRVLNVAMRANPVGLLIAAITIAIGLVVLLYRRSETFRRIVNAVFSAASGYVRAWVNVISTVVDWLRDKIPAALLWMRDKVADAVAAVRDKFTGIVDKLGDAADAIRNKLGDAFDWVMDKVQPLIDAIQWIVDKLGDIDLPDIPFVGRATTTSGTTGALGTVNITLPLLGSLAVADVQRLIQALDDYYSMQGLKIDVVPR